jgi:ribosomal protein S5
VRVVLEMAGIPNVVAKIMGSNNKINNAKATLCALLALKGASKVVLPNKFTSRPIVSDSDSKIGSVVRKLRGIKDIASTNE